METQEFDFDTWFDIMREHCRILGYRGPIDKGTFREEDYDAGKSPEEAAEAFCWLMEE